MKLYSVFRLFVVEKNKIKFICTEKNKGEYIEFFTKEKLKVDDNTKVESLSNYYSILEVANYENFKPLRINKKSILLKYIEINEKTKTYSKKKK